MKDEKQQGQKNTDTAVQQENKRSVIKATKERKLFKKKEKAVQEKELSEVKWVQIRLLPIWLRILLVILLLVGIGVLGLLMGYSVVGDGAPSEIFKKETWTHITDIIQGIE